MSVPLSHKVSIDDCFRYCFAGTCISLIISMILLRSCWCLGHSIKQILNSKLHMWLTLTAQELKNKQPDRNSNLTALTDIWLQLAIYWFETPLSFQDKINNCKLTEIYILPGRLYRLSSWIQKTIYKYILFFCFKNISIWIEKKILRQYFSVYFCNKTAKLCFIPGKKQKTFSIIKQITWPEGKCPYDVTIVR